MSNDRMGAAISVEAPERIWIESEGECPYFYPEEELSDVSPPITEYVRADKLEELAAEIEALRSGQYKQGREGSKNTSSIRTGQN